MKSALYIPRKQKKESGSESSARVELHLLSHLTLTLFILSLFEFLYLSAGYGLLPAVQHPAFRQRAF
jgi:hypothetical protein